MLKPLIIVEGPAGSGKTTFCETLASTLNLKTVSRSLPNRDPLEHEAVFQSAVNDFSKLMVALTSSKIPVIDRLVLSQWVYGSLRRKTSPTPGILRTWYIFEELLEAVLTDLDARSGIVSHGEHLYDPRILLVAFLPSESTIETRRHNAGRLFPHSPRDEIRRYQDMNYLRQNVKSFKFLDHVIHHEDDFGGPTIDKVQRWLHSWE